MPAHVPVAADPWYSSAIFWAIVAGVATVVGTIGTWITLFLITPRRRLLFGIRAAAPIMTAPEAVRSELQIFDRGARTARELQVHDQVSRVAPGQLV